MTGKAQISSYSSPVFIPPNPLQRGRGSALAGSVVENAKTIFGQKKSTNLQLPECDSPFEGGRGDDR